MFTAKHPTLPQSLPGPKGPPAPLQPWEAPSEGAGETG